MEQKMTQENKEPDYGNWVSKKLLYGSGTLSTVFLGLSFLFPILIVPALFFILAFVYFVYARLKFSPAGGNLQEKVRNLVLDYLEWDGCGRALDIGCGNGPLTIELAKKYPQSKVTGIDYWGAGWDYSRDLCEKNAELKGVSDQVSFQKASASRLPFHDETFDAAVSNFVFHEVADAKDKRDLVREALRVVRKGGGFAFQDLFLAEQFYGKTDDLLAQIKNWGVERVELVRTDNLDFIPGSLKLPFMLGKIAILYGRK
jgi:SAM-dependent methyltransferase